MPATDRSQDGGASRTATEAVEASDSEPAHSPRAELIDPHEEADGASYRSADAVTFVVGLGHEFPVHDEAEIVPVFDPERPEVVVG